MPPVLPPDDTIPKPIPSPPNAHWFWGHVQQMRRSQVNFPAHAALTFGSLVRLNFITRTAYVTADAGIARQVLTSEAASFSKGRNYENLALLAGFGLLNSETNTLWRTHRRMAQPWFYKERLAAYFQDFIHLAQESAAHWEHHHADKKEPVYLVRDMSEYTIKIVAKTLFGLDLGEEATYFTSEMRFLLTFVNKRNLSILTLPMWAPLPVYREFNRRRKKLYQYVDDLIRQRAAAPGQNDLLDIFLHTTDAETGAKLPASEIRDELITLMATGYETTSVAICWMWHVFEQYPQVREKAVAEIREICGDGGVTPAALMKFKYLNLVIKETMRLYPPVFTLTRRVDKDTLLNGYGVKKGAIIAISFQGMGRNPKYWPNPEKFDPGRFEEENLTAEQKGAYMPFGAGQRICIGQQFSIIEIIAYFAVALPKFKLEPVEGYVPGVRSSITATPSEGMPMYVQRA